MTVKSWADLQAEQNAMYHPNVQAEIFHIDMYHTDMCEIDQCTGEYHKMLANNKWSNLLAWAERVQKERGYPLQSFWENVRNEGDYKKCLELMQSTNRYSARSAKFYEKVPRSRFGATHADGTPRN